MNRIYEKFCELLSAHIEADEKWMPIQKAHELLGSVNEDGIWEQRNAAANALYKYIAELEAMVERLIEAGDDLAGFTMSATGDNGHSITLRKWHALVDRIQKEREE